MTNEDSGAAAGSPAAGTIDPSAAGAAPAGGNPLPPNAAEAVPEQVLRLDGPYEYWVGHPLKVYDEDVLNAYSQRGFLFAGKLHEWTDPVLGDPQVLLLFEDPVRKATIVANAMKAFQESSAGSGLLVPAGAALPPGLNPAALRGA